MVRKRNALETDNSTNRVLRNAHLGLDAATMQQPADPWWTRYENAAESAPAGH
jgi:hypothetical protein